MRRNAHSIGLNKHHSLEKAGKGFTLVEILVVMILIVLLAQIALFFLRGARDDARDTRIITDMEQYRNRAELAFAADADYDDVDVVADFVTLRQDMIVQGGTNFFAATSSDSSLYCAEVRLNNGE